MADSARHTGTRASESDRRANRDRPDRPRLGAFRPGSRAWHRLAFSRVILDGVRRLDVGFDLGQTELSAVCASSSVAVVRRALGPAGQHARRDRIAGVGTSPLLRKRLRAEHRSASCRAATSRRVSSPATGGPSSSRGRWMPQRQRSGRRWPCAIDTFHACAVTAGHRWHVSRTAAGAAAPHGRLRASRRCA